MFLSCLIGTLRMLVVNHLFAHLIINFQVIDWKRTTKPVLKETLACLICNTMSVVVTAVLDASQARDSNSFHGLTLKNLQYFQRYKNVQLTSCSSKKC